MHCHLCIGAYNYVDFTCTRYVVKASASRPCDDEYNSVSVTSMFEYTSVLSSMFLGRGLRVTMVSNLLAV